MAKIKKAKKTRVQTKVPTNLSQKASDKIAKIREKAQAYKTRKNADADYIRAQRNQPKLRQAGHAVSEVTATMTPAIMQGNANNTSRFNAYNSVINQNAKPAEGTEDANKGDDSTPIVIPRG